MASGIGPVLSLDMPINFVLYKLSLANVSLLLNEMNDPSCEAATSPSYLCCPLCANIQPRNVLFNCFAYLEIKNCATQRENLINSNCSLLPSPMGIQTLQGRNSWMLGIIYSDFPKHM